MHSTIGDLSFFASTLMSGMNVSFDDAAPCKNSIASDDVDEIRLLS